MAQEIVTWCDVHLDREENVPGRPRTGLGGSDRIVDLCDQCYKETFGPLLDVFEQFGRSAKAPSGSRKGKVRRASNGNAQVERARDGFGCPVSGCEETEVFATRSGLRSHLQASHDEELAVIERRMGYTVDGIEIKHLCEYDDCEAGFSTPQGRGAHMAHAHGYSGQSESAKKKKRDR